MILLHNTDVCSVCLSLSSHFTRPGGPELWKYVSHIVILCPKLTPTICVLLYSQQKMHRFSCFATHVNIESKSVKLWFIAVSEVSRVIIAMLQSC